MSATSAIQTFINATKATLASIATQITGLTTRLTNAEGRLTKAEADIKMLISQTSSGTAAPGGPTPDPCVYIVSSAYASLPTPGNRVGLSDVANMPTFNCGSGSSRCVITSSGAHHYRFVGINFIPQAGQSPSGLVQIGNNETSGANLPHHIILDRCVLQGDPTVNSRRGVSLNGNHCAVINSYLHNFKDDSSDSQAIWTYNSEGPLLIDNNFLEAASENVAFGGNDPTISGNVPSDITITRNYLFKRLSWIGSAWLVKNILETKNSQRVLVEGNVFENIWEASQAGYLLNFKSVNQSGNPSGQNCISQDWTFRNNRGKNLENGLTLSGDSQPPALASTRVLIQNNELQIASVNVSDGGFGVSITEGAGLRNLSHSSFLHNTIVGIINAKFHTEWGTSINDLITSYLVLQDNLFEGGGAFNARDHGVGTTALDATVTNGSVTYNCWQGQNSANYGAASGPGNTMANNFFPANQAAINFLNYAAANYRLNVASSLHNAASDGTDIGANIDTIDSYTLHCVDGQWGTEPPTAPSGSWTVAELPRAVVDARYISQSGTTIYVHAGGNLQTAVNAAQLGDTIIVDAGATFTPNLNLPAK